MLISNGKPYHFKRDKFRFRLAENLQWQDKDENIITVPKGFLSDGASIPSPLREIFGELTDDPCDRINIAAYIHDFPFTNGHMLIVNNKPQTLTLAQLDKLFHTVLLDLGVKPQTAFALYAGVRLGSWCYW
jgi:hypothetical protein